MLSLFYPLCPHPFSVQPLIYNYKALYTIATVSIDTEFLTEYQMASQFRRKGVILAAVYQILNLLKFIKKQCSYSVLKILIVPAKQLK